MILFPHSEARGRVLGVRGKDQGLRGGGKGQRVKDRDQRAVYRTCVLKDLTTVKSSIVTDK